MSSNNKITTIRLSPDHQVFLNNLKQKLNLNNQGVLSVALEALHAKKFPAYKQINDQRIKEKNKTPEEKCAELNGTITMKGMLQGCSYEDGALQVFTPLHLL